ncbi:MAG TPA: GNAT family N-acetyltransferase [Anaerolineales bacterium]
MEYTLQAFAGIDDHVLRRVALLHQSVMRNLLTDLGFPIILRYYQIARKDSAVIGFCAVSSSQEILGWVVGSPDPYALNMRLRSPLSWFLVQMMVLAVKRSPVFLQTLSSVFHSSQQKLIPHAIELTYIGVAPNVQGNGIGRALLEAFIEASRALDYCSVELTTETDNLHALALYQKSGFSVKRTFKEGRFERYRMERKLSA